MEVERICPVCGKKYIARTERLKFGRQTTCSRECSYKMRAQKLKKSIKLTCPVCGKVFEKPPSQIKGKYGVQYCSAKCQYKGRTLGFSRRIVTKPYNISDEARIAWKRGAEKTRKIRMEKGNYSFSKETKAKISESVCRQISEGRINTVSNLEKKVMPILIDMKINFIHQYPVRDEKGRFVCVFDFFIPDKKFVIEVNGTFWHSDPRVYEKPIHEIQKRNAKAWERKLRIIDTLGYHLIVLWEKDIKEIGDPYIKKSLSAIV